MKIELAKNSGFCFGVDRAINILENEILTNKKPIYTFGPLIHNPQMIEELKNKGVNIINSVNELPENSITIIRTHGITKEQLSEIKGKGIDYIDATCPFVLKIQNIVKEQSNNSMILIAGDCQHPEIEGIMSYANSPVYTFSTLAEFESIARNNTHMEDFPVILVAQTTFSKNEWRKIAEYAKKIYTNIKIFDTICNATEDRQLQAEELAKKSDAVIVIGGKNSSNTTKLFEICKSICRDTFHIESSEDLQFERLKYKKNIGVTAGASTPSVIIKEVLKTMEENIAVNKNNEEFSFEEALDKTFLTLHNGDRVKGIVVSISPSEIQMDLGTKQAGYLTASEFSDDPNVNLSELVKVGDELEVQVVRLNDVEGTVMLSTRRVQAYKSFLEVVEASKDGTVLNGKIVENVNAGLIANYKGVKIFIPASHSGVPRDGDLNSLLNATVSFKILEVQTGGRRRKIVGSIKNASRETSNESQKKIFSDIEVNKKYVGTVKSITSFGAFVDIGGVDGMVHISELSWSKIKHPSEIVSIGETIEVYIKEFDKQTKRISLGYKNLDENPYNKFKEKYSVGDQVEVKIVRIMPFGAFGEIMPLVDGLIHISQISDRRVNRIYDFIKIGDVVKVKITQIDNETNKISLSIKALILDENPIVQQEKPIDNNVETDSKEVIVSKEANITEEKRATKKVKKNTDEDAKVIKKEKTKKETTKVKKPSSIKTKKNTDEDVKVIKKEKTKKDTTKVKKPSSKKAKTKSEE